jgi:hypothetical protein
MRFQFNIAPNTPLEKLLPTPPRTKRVAGPALGDSLGQIPEVEFQHPLAKDLPANEALKDTAHLIARINHLNGKKTDGFLEALQSERSDLAGLPFAMGDACRTKGEHSRQFAAAVALVRGCLQPRVVVRNGVGVGPLPRASVAVPVTAPSGAAPAPPPPPVAPQPTPAPVPVNPPAQAEVPQDVPVNFVVTERVAEDHVSSEGFWDKFSAACAQEDKKQAAADRALCETITRARIAALMQVLAPESPALRLGLAKHLSSLADVEATRALARLAIFSAEDEVRQAAIDGLKVRRERDYTDILLQGFRYPWPAVARRAGEALVKLERADLVPQLLDVLDAPDPRAPVVREVNSKKVSAVRELVRVNHHQSCLLCHAPGNTNSVSPEAVTAAVPIPSEALPSPGEGYRTSVPDVLVRVDVTYLRQDFSALLPVGDAHPWPEMQRFDFLVRTRTLTDEEVAVYREKLAPREPGQLSPYHRAALVALRELTGRDTEPTPDAWRRLLALPTSKRG